MGSQVYFAVLEEAANGVLRWVRLRGFARSEERATAMPGAFMQFATREEAEAHAVACRQRNATEVRQSRHQARRNVKPATYVVCELNRTTVDTIAFRAKQARVA